MEERPGAPPCQAVHRVLPSETAHTLTHALTHAHALLFFNLLNKTESIFSSASCEASQLATENYTHCQSPFCYLGDTETAPGREQVPALCPHPGGRLIKRPDFGRDLGMGALVEPSRVSCWFQNTPAWMGAGQEPHAVRRCCWGENHDGWLDQASSRGAQLCQGPWPPVLSAK